MVLSAKILCSVCSGNADHKYKKHPSINTFRCATKSLSNFHFCQVDEKTVRKEIKNLEISKAVQDSDFPIKLLMENG